MAASYSPLLAARCHATIAEKTPSGAPRRRRSEEKAGDQLKLEFARIRVEPGDDALGARAVDLDQLCREPKPTRRRPAAGQCEGPAVFARRARAEGVAQLRREYIEAAGGMITVSAAATERAAVIRV